MTGCDPRPYPLPASEWLGYDRPETHWRTHSATPDKRWTNTRCRRRGVSGPDFRIFAQPSADQRVYAMPARSGSAVSERKRQGRGKKAKSLPHNKFTHVNAPAASGIPAAPHVGMTCHSFSRRRRRRAFDFLRYRTVTRETGFAKPPGTPLPEQGSASESGQDRAAKWAVTRARIGGLGHCGIGSRSPSTKRQGAPHVGRGLFTPAATDQQLKKKLIPACHTRAGTRGSPDLTQPRSRLTYAA